MDATDVFEAHRPRLLAVASRMLAERAEAEDVVQQAWLRWRDAAEVDNPEAWLTTVTSRLCLDRLRARTPVAVEDADVFVETAATATDPLDDVMLSESVGAALGVVLERLSPRERVAFVLHDSFTVEFATIASILDTTPAAARKLASRARAAVAGGTGGGRTLDAPPAHGVPSDREVVDAFMAAARGGRFEQLLALLAPDIVVDADAAAIAIGTPERIEGRRSVAEFFDGAASAALPVVVDGRPAAAWYHRGAVMVLFEVEIVDGLVGRVTFRADPSVLATVVRRP